MRSDPHEDQFAWTDWSTMTVGQMWDVLTDFDRAPATEQTAGWNRTFELLDYHRVRLEEYRDMLRRDRRGGGAGAVLARGGEVLASILGVREAGGVGRAGGAPVRGGGGGGAGERGQTSE